MSGSHGSPAVGLKGGILGAIAGTRIESPQISLRAGFQPNLLFDAGTQRLGPNYPKFRLVLPILQCDQAANFEFAADRTQPNSGPADVESMYEFGIGFAGNIVAGNSYRQHCLGPVRASLFACSCLFYQSCQSFIRRVQCDVLDLIHLTSDEQREGSVTGC